MQATALDVSALADLVSHHRDSLRVEGRGDVVTMPNKIPTGASMTLRRIEMCVSAGLLVPAGGVLMLTAKGVAGVKLALAESTRDLEAKTTALAWLVDNTTTRTRGITQ